MKANYFCCYNEPSISLLETALACPYFLPAKPLEAGWLHPSRLPLGGGWSGTCCAGTESYAPAESELRELCNLGYAAACPRLPLERAWDAVRFSVARDRGSLLDLWFICENAHRPAAHGHLEYDTTQSRWVSPHSDPRVQKMAECYVQSYLLRRTPSVHTAASANS